MYAQSHVLYGTLLDRNHSSVLTSHLLDAESYVDWVWIDLVFDGCKLRRFHGTLNHVLHHHQYYSHEMNAFLRNVKFNNNGKPEARMKDSSESAWGLKDLHLPKKLTLEKRLFKHLSNYFQTRNTNMKKWKKKMVCRLPWLSLWTGEDNWNNLGLSVFCQHDSTVRTVS